MAMAIGELRRLNKKFAFTVQFADQAKPPEVVSDTKAVAHRRIRALRASDSAWKETLRQAHLHQWATLAREIELQSNRGQF
jgi:hypothetical protein